MALFGTNGIRGKIDLLTPELAMRVCAAFVRESGAKHIVVGRDMRLTGPLLSEAAISGVLSAGCDVTDIGLVSSPTAEFMLHKLSADGAIIVTASHNPPEWNALKFVDKNGIAISSERGLMIERRMAAGSTSALSNGIAKLRKYPYANADHANAVVSFVNAEKIRKRKLKICLDFGNGTSSLVAPDIFHSLGCGITTLNSHLDGTFPGRPSEPTEKNLSTLCKCVSGGGFDFGVGWDGDSDRVIFVDEKGRWLVGDVGFAISADIALSELEAKGKSGGNFARGGISGAHSGIGGGEGGWKVVTTVATSRVIEDVCKRHGAQIVYTKVGAPYISEKMHELTGICASGGEEVGGIVWPSFGLAKDGLLAAAKIAEAVCAKPLSEYANALPKYYNAKMKVECKSDVDRKKVIGALIAGEKGNGRLISIDGMRLDFADSWVIARPSGTENYFRVFAEAKSEAKASALAKKYAKKVKDLL
jgi:phosphomannomutase/phosphoglucomutase